MNGILRDEQTWFLHQCGALQSPGLRVDDILVDITSAFQRIRIIENEVFGRTLILDEDPQTSERDEAHYHEPLVFPAMLLAGNPKRVFIAGGGDGAVAKNVLKFNSVEYVLIAEIDEEVVRCCRQVLRIDGGALGDPRVSVQFGDAADVLRESRSQYDCIILDLTCEDASSLSGRCYTTDFFALARSKLAPGGFFSTQAHSTHFFHSGQFKSIWSRAASVFPLVWSYHAFVPLYCTTWGFLICGEEPGTSPSQSEFESRLLATGALPVCHNAASLAAGFFMPNDFHQD